MQDSIIPRQEEGKSVDISEIIDSNSEEEARSTFTRAKDRLLNPDAWHDVAGELSARFKLVARGENIIRECARVNDFIQIEIPGPGNVEGEGYDWVKIKNIDYQPKQNADESFAMTVEVAENPNTSGKEIAHFFREGATSTYMLTRKGKKIIATYHGRNELPNINKPDITGKIRNALVAIAAICGISEIQWRYFLKGLIKEQI